MTRFGSALALVWMTLALLAPSSAGAQGATPQPGGAFAAQPMVAPGQGALNLSATLTTGGKPIQAGLEWRVFQERAESDGAHALVAKSSDATPVLRLPDGDYVAHVAYGLASAMKRVSVRGASSDQALVLNAGALRIGAVLGDSQIPANRLQIAVYVPERAGNEARLVVADAKPATIIRVPEGSYRIISTYLDKEGAGTTPGAGAHPNTTNSVVNAEVRVQAGKTTDVTLRHHAAVLTLKLVNAPGGEALANTSFSVLTPGGDVIREMIGAFPSLVLAEGEYVVIARRDGKTYQGTFNVQSTLDRDIEVIAK